MSPLKLTGKVSLLKSPDKSGRLSIIKEKIQSTINSRTVMQRNQELKAITNTT